MERTAKTTSSSIHDERTESKESQHTTVIVEKPERRSTQELCKQSTGSKRDSLPI